MGSWYLVILHLSETILPCLADKLLGGLDIANSSFVFSFILCKLYILDVKRSAFWITALVQALRECPYRNYVFWRNTVMDLTKEWQEKELSCWSERQGDVAEAETKPGTVWTVAVWLQMNRNLKQAALRSDFLLLFCLYPNPQSITLLVNLFTRLTPGTWDRAASEIIP